MIERFCVIGVGLIGGSIARSVRRQRLCRVIVGVDTDHANLRKALDLGVIDVGCADAGVGAAGADWVVLATPVGTFGPVLSALRPVWSERAIYTDVGSTKQSVVEAVRAVFGSIPPNFVPGHPIAGAEQSGVEAATDDLYQGKRVILTPLPTTSPDAVRQVEAVWEAIGAHVSRMDPSHHDEVLAATSHLPHVLAYALVHMLGEKDEQQEIFQYAAAGFRDFTRIASSDPKMWLDICLANREQIAPLIAQLCGELGRVSKMLDQGAAVDLFEFFASARNARQRFLDQVER